MSAMDSRTPLSNLQIDVSCGPVPCDTEEGRGVLEERHVLFGKVCFFACFGLYLFFHAVSTARGVLTPADWLFNPGSQIHLGMCLVFLSVYLVSRFLHPSQLGLRVLDGTAIGAVGVLSGLGYAWGWQPSQIDPSWLLAITHTLLVRAIIIPSSGLHTVLIGVLASVPLLVGFEFGSVAELQSPPGDSPWFGLCTPFAASWLCVTVVTATVASQVLYGLRREVEEAQQLGQYTLEERVGEGGMGEVYRASHLLLRRPTAVKLLRADHLDGRSISRFEREVQLTSRLTHPNTIAIYDYGRTPEGRFYYAMEYLDGVNLEQLIQAGGALPPARVIHVLRQVCASIAEAHRSGLIHRDIKPANVILCERGGIQDFVKVVDFGLVKDIVSEADANVSAANTITGTPLYLSPEAIRAPETIDARSDLYAVGALGYYLLTGTPLFETTNVMEVCNHQMNTTPQPPSERMGKTQPSDLESLILRCLEKDPAARLQTAEAVCEALDACEDANGWSTAQAVAWWEENKTRVAVTRGSGTESTAAVSPSVAVTATGTLGVKPSVARAGR